jgi:phage shock protein E
MQTYVILGLALAFFIVTWYLRRPDITPARARELLAEGALLIDVRSPSEFSSGHINGARNIPVGALSAREGELGVKDRPVILYCASGARSAMAKRTLRAAGFSRAHNLGSLSNW